MIVFTITNNITDEVWVGTTRDSSAERWEQYKEAMAAGASHAFYKDLRDFGVKSFTLDDFAVADSREELKDLVEEAMDTYDGKSLSGVKTTLTKEEIAKVRAMEASVIESSLSKAAAAAAEEEAKPEQPALRIPNKQRLTAPSLVSKPQKAASAPRKPIPKPSGNRSFGASASTATGINGRPLAKKAKAADKLASGRTGSAAKERSIKEAIAAEKAARESEAAKRALEQADEMKAILARLDSRGSTLKKK